MKIYVIGTRGFPGIQGGVEKHCEFLYRHIGKKGNFVTVFRRKPYLNNNNQFVSYPGVSFIDLWTIKNKNFETIIHSILAALKCMLKHPDIVHIHNIGPALVLPLLRFVGLKTVVTYHSPNYKHEKWGGIAKLALILGEKLVNLLANETIFVSQKQADLFKSEKKSYIVNGVELPIPSTSVDYLNKIGVKKGSYMLGVGRFAPEKGFHCLIQAFEGMQTDCKLVIAGDADHETSYSKRIREAAAKNSKIVLTGYIDGEKLNQVYTNARLFVLPSYHEGHPIALLEAMSYGLSVLVSDIPANLDVGLNSDRYFKCGDAIDLQRKMEMLIMGKISDDEKYFMRKKIEDEYNWDDIGDRTIEIYKNILKKGSCWNPGSYCGRK